MVRKKYEVLIASVPDREHVVAEIWCDECQLAEMRREGEEVFVELYPHPQLPAWDFNYQDLLHLLATGNQKLPNPVS